jgi:hypothetical protein
MSSTTTDGSRPGFDLPLAALLCRPELPLADVLTTQHVEQAFDRHQVSFGTAHNSILSPAVTLWAWLSQVIFADKSCAAACARVGVLLLALSRPKWSEDTGCYCRARARLGALVLQELALGVAQRLEQACPPAWRWRGRRCWLADGSTLSLADTQANQQAYPQPASQKKGLGFPMIRLVILASLAVGTINGLAWGPYQGKQTGEMALLLRLLERLQPGDVLVADRYYCTYLLLALLSSRPVDAVLRLHGNRHCDFRKGQRLGKGDHIVVWHRPPRPDWLSEEDYQRLPKQLRVRELDVTVNRPGFKGERVVLATTLVDAAAYAKEELADLYRQRWLIEVDLRGLKKTLGLSQLEAKTPAMVAAELWAHVLGYNLTRKVMAQAALQPARPSRRPSRQRRGAAARPPLLPRQISLKAALQQLSASWQALSHGSAAEQQEAAQRLLATLAGKRVGQRPGRREPRAIKRRPRNRPILQVPRAEAKQRLGCGQAKGKGAQPAISKRRHR